MYVMSPDIQKHLDTAYMRNHQQKLLIERYQRIVNRNKPGSKGLIRKLERQAHIAQHHIFMDMLPVIQDMMGYAPDEIPQMFLSAKHLYF